MVICNLESGEQMIAEKKSMVWIDTANHIVSFKSVEDFEQLSFSSYDEMIGFVIEKGASGYRIQ